MRRQLKLTLCLLITSSALVFAQSTENTSSASPQIIVGESLKAGFGKPKDNTAPTPEAYRRDLIRRILESDESLKQFETPLHRMGDEVAVDIKEILGTNDSLSESQEKRIVDVLQVAFERPQAILTASNESPTVTLLFLEHLESLTSDSVRRDRIATAMERIISTASRKSR